jgi:hypothetical protein
LGAGEMDEQVFAEHCDRLVVEDCNSKAWKITSIRPIALKILWHATSNLHQMISIGPLFIILVIHWELVKWTSRFLLVTSWLPCGWGLWLRSYKKSSHFSPSLEKFMTWHNQSAPDDQHRTTVHHSCDPLGAGERDSCFFCQLVVAIDRDYLKRTEMILDQSLSILAQLWLAGNRLFLFLLHSKSCLLHIQNTLSKTTKGPRIWIFLTLLSLAQMLKYHFQKSLFIWALCNLSLTCPSWQTCYQLSRHAAVFNYAFKCPKCP